MRMLSGRLRCTSGKLARIVWPASLGPLIERFYFASTMVYGYKWVVRPGVLVIFALTAICLYVGLRIQRKEIEVQSTGAGGES